jgi:hypothetical protein
MRGSTVSRRELCRSLRADACRVPADRCGAQQNQRPTGPHRGLHAPPTVPDPTPTRSFRHCPECGSPVLRVLRTANDKRRWDADSWRRYRCRSDRCDWQGLLSAAGRRRRTSTSASGGAVLARMGRVALLLLMAIGLGWGGLVALQLMMGL